MTTRFYGAATRQLSRVLLGLSIALIGVPFWRPAGASITSTQPVAANRQKSCAEPLASDKIAVKQRRCQLPRLTDFENNSGPPTMNALGLTLTTPSTPLVDTLQLADAPVTADSPDSSVQRVDVDPAIIEGSPVLQRWLEEVPDLAVDIHHDPAFRTRVRMGYVEFPSTDNTGGVYVGVQDVFVGRTPLTLSAEYAVNGRGDRQVIGADAQYYLLPLGWYGNVAPVIGYRDIQTSAFDSSGVNLGVRVILIPSRTGTADLSVTQSWVAPGTDREVGLTTFAAGYAIAEDLRIGTDIQIQNARERQESRVGILLEWML